MSSQRNSTDGWDARPSQKFGAGDESTVRIRSQLTRDAERIERLAAVGTLAAALAHELLSPIASIRMAAQHAQEVSDVARQQRILAAIVDASDRCRCIAEGLTRFVNEGRVEKRPSDLHAIVLRSSGVVRAEPRGAGLSIRATIDDGVRSIPCDPSALEQVFVSLFRGAAVRAYPTACQLTVRAVREGDSAVVTLSPTVRAAEGDGRARYRASPRVLTDDGVEERGWESVLVTRIVTAHGGSVELADATDSGAVQRLTLPLA